MSITTSVFKTTLVKCDVKQMAYHFNNQISIIGITEELNDEAGFK
ncbi:hypothetical protein [Staphylococcus equorum]|nr:hypothetical protein [Staphylococcus equorum]